MIRFILILLIVFIGIRLFFRFVVPLLLGLFAKRMMRKMNPDFKDFEKKQQNKKRKTGEVHVDYIPGNSEKKDKKGEYVDFEEVD